MKFQLWETLLLSIEFFKLCFLFAKGFYTKYIKQVTVFIVVMNIGNDLEKLGILI